MNNQRTLPIFKIRNNTGVQNEPGRVEFEGIISTQNLDSYYTRMSDSTLRNFARDARNGVPILGNHDYRTALLGQSLSGHFHQKEKVVTSRFFIQEGLSTPNALYGTSDDFINAIKGGTLTDISVGFYGGKDVCDFCGEEIRGQGIFWAADKNGHYGGKKIFVKDGQEVPEGTRGAKELTITSMVYDATLGEFSTVWSGATPGAEITKKAIEAYQAGELEPEHFDFIRCHYGLHAHRHIMDSINNLEPKTRFFGGFKMAPENGFNEERIQAMIADETQSTREEQAAALRQVIAERDALALKLDEVGDRDTVEANQRNAVTRIKELEDQVASMSAVAEEHAQIMATMRQATMEQFDRKHDYKASETDRNNAEKEVNNCNSFYLLRQLFDAFKESADARTAANSVGRRTFDYDPLMRDQLRTDELYRKAKISGTNSYL